MTHMSKDQTKLEFKRDSFIIITQAKYAKHIYKLCDAFAASLWTPKLPSQ